MPLIFRPLYLKLVYLSSVIITGKVQFVLSGRRSCSYAKSTVSASLLFSSYPVQTSCCQRSGRADLKMSTMATVEDYKHCNIQSLKDLGVDDYKKTDVIVAGRREDATEHVIFFGGDVQDYPENMMSHRDNGQYVRWNSLATAALLCRRFPSAMVMVIKPHHMHLKTFSVYSQFVESNDFGCPTHSKDAGAWHVLQEVYISAVTLALQSVQDGQVSGENNAILERKADDKDSSVVTQAAGQADLLPSVPLHLIGFSKGCIVLNQLVHELGTVKVNRPLFDFIQKVRAMTWLDGGHSGGSNTWVTDPDVLTELAALNIEIIVHVTPYQVKDEMRKWIGKEKRKFVELMTKAGAKVTDTLHFDDLPKSIDNHFRVLEVF